MSAAMIISHNICLFITHRTNAEGKKEYLMLDYPGYVREKDHVGNSIPSQIHHMSNLPNVTALGFPHGREKLELDEPITTTIERVFKDRTGATLKTPWDSTRWIAGGTEEEPCRWLMFTPKTWDGSLSMQSGHTKFEWYTVEQLREMKASGVVFTDGTADLIDNHLD